MRFVALASIVPALAACGSSSSPNITAGLVGESGPGFRISLIEDGVIVKHLEAGKHVFTIEDRSSIHNFHLVGPGVDEKTSVSAVGTVTWTVTLSKGTYEYICDPHASFMKGSFSVS